MLPVLHAFRMLLARICHWGWGSAVTDAAPDLEKANRITENQLRGTSHGHYFTTDSALPPKISGNQYAFNICSNSQRVCQFYCTYISFLLIRIRSSFPVLSRRMCFWMTCPMCPTIRIARCPHWNTYDFGGFQVPVCK